MNVRPVLRDATRNHTTDHSYTRAALSSYWMQTNISRFGTLKIDLSLARAWHLSKRESFACTLAFIHGIIHLRGECRDLCYNLSVRGVRVSDYDTAKVQPAAGCRRFTRARQRSIGRTKSGTLEESERCTCEEPLMIEVSGCTCIEPGDPPGTPFSPLFLHPRRKIENLEPRCGPSSHHNRRR